MTIVAVVFKTGVWVYTRVTPRVDDNHKLHEAGVCMKQYKRIKRSTQKKMEFS